MSKESPQALDELKSSSRALASFQYRPLGDIVEVSVFSNPDGIRYVHLPDSAAARALSVLQIQGRVAASHGPSVLDWMISEMHQNLQVLIGMRAICTALPSAEDPQETPVGGTSSE